MRPGLWIAAAALAFVAAPAEADSPEGFETYCAKCHGADGKAETAVGKAMKVPALVGRNLDKDTVVHVIRSNAKHKAVSSKVDDDLLEDIADHVESLSKSD